MVSGARGFIGRHLVAHLHDGGHDVIGLARSTVLSGAPETVGWAWPEGAGRFDALVHLAALNPDRRDVRSRDVAALHKANVEGTRLLAERAAAEGVGRFVFLSTASVHQPKREASVSERDQPLPQSAYAGSKLAAEAVLREVASHAGLETCVLRPPPVYGRGGRGAIAALRRLAMLRMPLPGNERTLRRSLLAVDNCVDAIAVAVAHPQAAGGTFLVADDDPMTLAELIAAMRHAVGRPPWLLPFPERLIRALAKIDRRGRGLKPLVESFVIDDTRIRERLGWRPVVSTEEGLRRLLRT